MNIVLLCNKSYTIKKFIIIIFVTAETLCASILNYIDNVLHVLQNRNNIKWFKTYQY